MPENKEVLEAMESGVKGLRSEFEQKFSENEKAQKELNEKLEGLKSLSTKEEVENAVKEMQSQFDELATKMNKQSVKGTEAKSFEVELTEKKEDLTKLVKGRSGATLEIKADTLRASITGNTDSLKLPGIGRYGRIARSLYDVFPKMPVNSGDHNGVIKYHDWDEASSAEAAAAVAEGAVYPESTAVFQEYTLPIRKIGDTLPVSEEFGEDAVTASAELQLFVATNVESKVDEQIVNGDNTGQNLKGLMASVPAFTAPQAGIATPNIYDLVKKVRTSIVKNRGSKYQPDFVAMNADTIDQLELEKDANGQYLFPERTGIGSMAIVEDNNIAANQLVVGDSRFGRIYEMGGVELSKGQPNAQFVEDMATIKARKRLAFLIRNVDADGFRKVTDVDAALTTLGTTPV